MTLRLVPDDDPEVAADLALREASMRDRSRTRDARYDWTPPAIVGQWRCRTKCGSWVPVPVEAMEAFVIFNQQLRAHGEQPLDPDAILYCPDCTVEFKRTAADRRRGQVERMRRAIRDLKGTKDAERQRELLDQLKVWHHPDIDGLVAWLRERDKSTTGRRRDL